MENIALTSIIYCSDLTYSVSVSTISWNMYINFLRWKTNKDEPTIYWMPLSGVFKSVVFNLSENESKLTSDTNMSGGRGWDTVRYLLMREMWSGSKGVAKKGQSRTLYSCIGITQAFREQGVKVAYATYSSTRGFRAGTSSTTGISVWKRNTSVERNKSQEIFHSNASIP